MWLRRRTWQGAQHAEDQQVQRLISKKRQLRRRWHRRAMSETGEDTPLARKSTGGGECNRLDQAPSRALARACPFGRRTASTSCFPKVRSAAMVARTPPLQVSFPKSGPEPTVKMDSGSSKARSLFMRSTESAYRVVGSTGEANTHPFVSRAAVHRVRTRICRPGHSQLCIGNHSCAGARLHI